MPERQVRYDQSRVFVQVRNDFRLLQVTQLSLRIVAQRYPLNVRTPVLRRFPAEGSFQFFVSV
jgi:hypothetical protein